MTIQKQLLRAAVTVLVAFLGTGYLPTALSACDPLVPNLRPLPASDISLVLDASGNPSALRFAVTSWNSGLGRLELVAKEVDTTAQKQRVDQRIYDSCGHYQDYAVGSFEWHQAHNHFHFEGYANYFLTPIGTAGQGRNGSKTTFCVMDTTSINPQVWGASSQTYTSCGNTIQGMSVGWGDTYGSQLEGQSIDATGLTAGDYALEINIDPFKRLIETNDADNWACAVVRFAGAPYATSFNILERKSGRCADVAEPVSIGSISPNMVPTGWTGTATIKGSGFDPVMRVTISSGSDSATVSDVLFIDSATIQTTVRVPRKKRLKDPTMDVGLSSPYSYTGVETFRDGFTVVGP
jgi:hypothetical protein